MFLTKRNLLLGLKGEREIGDLRMTEEASLAFAILRNRDFQE
jgi:hypothetical protein